MFGCNVDGEGKVDMWKDAQQYTAQSSTVDMNIQNKFEIYKFKVFLKKKHPKIPYFPFYIVAH